MTFPLLFDDAAIFPPGNLPLREAIPAHQMHRKSAYAELVGPLVVGLEDLSSLIGEGPLELAVVVPDAEGASAAIDIVRGLDDVRLIALEVRETTASALSTAVGDPDGVAVYVELPRGSAAAGVVDDLVGTPYRAKIRTGGLEPAMYPDEAELAATLVALAAAAVPFKATAGLHHALRNTDPETGFEQHGFVNLLAATELARLGAETQDVALALAERDVRGLPALPRRSLLGSIGTCVISEPIAELNELGLVVTR